MPAAAAWPALFTQPASQVDVARLAERDDPDRELAERFRAGDRSAFETLVRRHQKGVWRIVRRYIRRDADAADITQQVFVRAFKGLATFRGAATVRSWLYRIAINSSLTWIRDHKREILSDIDDDSLSVDAAGPGRIANDQEAKMLRIAIDELPPKQRMVLELRIYDDLSFKEVAELADCSENTAKVSFHYAVKKLREILGGSDDPR